MFTAAASHLRFETSTETGSLAQEYRKVLAHYSRVALGLHNLGENLREDWRSGAKADILALMGQFSNRAASDERDNIFALRGLAKDGALITPDYALSVADTYIHVTLRMIDASLSLDVIIGAFGTKNKLCLPAWTPDWSTSYGTVNSVWSQSTRLLDASKGAAAVLQDLHMKCPTQTPESYIRISRMMEEEVVCVPVQPCSEGAIRLPGHNVGTIKWVRESYFSDEDRLATLKSWWSSTSKAALLRKPVGLDDSMRTICADLWYDVSGAEGQQSRRMNALDLARLLPLHLCIMGLEEVALDAEAELSIRLAATRRRLFLTGKGTLGLAPLDTCIGDLVFILPGGRTPFILHKGDVIDRPQEREKIIASEEEEGDGR